MKIEELVEIGLKTVSWPAAAVFVVSWFKSEIRQFIVSIRHVKAGDAELSTMQVAQVAAKGLVDSQIGSAPEKPIVQTGILADKHAAQLKELLKDKSADEKLEWASAIAINATCVVTMGHLYITTFGSQLALLDVLAGLPNLKIDHVKKEFYDPVVARFPDAYSAPEAFQNWLNFLKETDLATIEGDQISITVFGREFLIFIIGNNLSRFKNL